MSERANLFASQCEVGVANYRKISILGVESPLLVKILNRYTFLGKCFVDHGGDFLWARDGNYCKCHYVDQMTRRLIDK